MQLEVTLLTACISFLAAVISLLTKIPEMAALAERAAAILRCILKKVLWFTRVNLEGLSAILKKLPMLHATLDSIQKKFDLLVNTSKKVDRCDFSKWQCWVGPA